MSKSATTVGCPHCGTASTVELVQGEATTADAAGEDRLKGRLVDCNHCGGEFSFYHY